MTKISRVFQSILLASLVSSSPVRAETKLPEKVNLTVTVLCTGRVECTRGQKAFENARKYYEERFDLTFEMKSVLRSPIEATGSTLERWAKLGAEAIKLGTASSDLTVVFENPYPASVDQFDFEEEGIIGLASGIGVLGLVPSAVFIKEMGGEKFLTRLIIHEIGHVLGARHTSAGIMYPSMSVAQYCDELSLESSNAIKKHLLIVKVAEALKPPMTPILPEKKVPSYGKSPVEG